MSFVLYFEVALLFFPTVRDCEEQAAQNADTIVVVYDPDKSPQPALLNSSLTKDSGSESDGSAPDEVPIAKESAFPCDVDSIEKSSNSNESRKRRRHNSSWDNSDIIEKNDEPQLAAKRSNSEASNQNGLPENADRHKPSFGARGRGRGRGRGTFNNNRIRLRPPTLLEKVRVVKFKLIISLFFLKCCAYLRWF